MPAAARLLYRRAQRFPREQALEDRSCEGSELEPSHSMQRVAIREEVNLAARRLVGRVSIGRKLVHRPVVPRHARRFDEGERPIECDRFDAIDLGRFGRSDGKVGKLEGRQVR